MEQQPLTGRAESPSALVIDAVADAMDSDPMQLDKPLYEAVDPDALDRLCDADCELSVSFEYLGHTVVVRSDDTVLVDGTEER